MGIKLADLQASLLQDSDADESGGYRNESLQYFAEGWNAVLGDMRASDLLSNAELALLVFRCWHSSGVGGTHFSRCTYLPVFCTAGKLNVAFNLCRKFSAEAELQTLRKRSSLELQLHHALAVCPLSTTSRPSRLNASRLHPARSARSPDRVSPRRPSSRCARRSASSAS